MFSGRLLISHALAGRGHSRVVGSLRLSRIQFVLRSSYKSRFFLGRALAQARAGVLSGTG